ncbi:hypothetical protein [Embleya sp. AB8]|uniref:hypothetical protein n=1 Tax=Embleya sp. AB8 TaxID=3156304 RepID=UPI003C716A85
MDCPRSLPDHYRLGNPYAPRLVAAGETFDVIEVDEVLGTLALDLLHRRGVHVGPILHDRRHRKMGFLVPVTAKGTLWRDRQSPAHHSKGTWITFPAPLHTDHAALVWRIPPHENDIPTPLALVRAAITAASIVLAPDPPAP